MTALRILMVIDYKLAYLGGAQTAFIQQANALAAAGHTVTIAAPDASTLADPGSGGYHLLGLPRQPRDSRRRPPRDPQHRANP
jgi:hypothetical protein